MWYYHFDRLGSVAALSSEDADIVEKYTYDVYGKPTIRNANDEILTKSACYNRYMFTGREYHDSTGLYYYRARFYNPEIGRFMQTDPKLSWFNLYTYCLNNPVNLVDPTGGCSSEVPDEVGEEVIEEMLETKLKDLAEEKRIDGESKVA